MLILCTLRDSVLNANSAISASVTGEVAGNTVQPGGRLVGCHLSPDHLQWMISWHAEPITTGTRQSPCAAIN
jgi:hypothetical protein